MCFRSDKKLIRLPGTQNSKLNVSPGFTIIEILFVLAISTAIFLIISTSDFSIYAARSLDAEMDSVIGLLRRARVKAMNNTNQSDQGFYISNDKYIVFQGSSYPARDADFDEEFPRSARIAVSGLSEVVFSAIEGSSGASGTIAFSSASGTASISVNYEGRINR